MGYEYSYLIGSLFFLVIWVILFLWRKDVRKEMLIISLTIGILGILSNILYTTDWWSPISLSGLRWGGIEDLIFGFSITGIAAVAYEEFFGKKIRLKKHPKKQKHKKNIEFVYFILALAIILAGSFYILKLHSFWASIIASGAGILFIWAKRKDLIKNSIFSGIIFMLISWICFIVVELITPGWVQSAWLFENLSGIILLKAPLEDLIWFLLVGALIGPLYEYWQEVKEINLK